MVQHQSIPQHIDSRGFKRKGGCVHIINFRVTTAVPDCIQNQTAVSDTLRLLSDF